jgi:hypothetical protein
VADQCIGKTSSGKRCELDALEGSNFCRRHGPNARPRLYEMKAAKKPAKKAKKTAKKVAKKK